MHRKYDNHRLCLLSVAQRETHYDKLRRLQYMQWDGEKKGSLISLPMRWSQCHNSNKAQNWTWHKNILTLALYRLADLCLTTLFSAYLHLTTRNHIPKRYRKIIVRILFGSMFCMFIVYLLHMNIFIRVRND